MDNILYNYLRGSKLYGLNTEKSDEDISGVYIQNINDILGLRNKYKEQMNVDGNDYVLYEVGRWIELLIKGNPNMIEGLFVPYSKMLVKPHECLEPIFKHRDNFLTKELAKILTQYAHSQISKARGLNKLIVTPIEEKKDVLDFCYTFYKQGTISIKDFLTVNFLHQRYCGLVNIPHMHDVYGLYYDFRRHYNEHKNTRGYLMGQMLFLKNLKTSYGTTDIESIKETRYRGIVSTNDESNEVRLSSVEKNIQPLCYMSFNKSGYSKFCVDYKKYQDWKKNRNPERYRINTDSKRNYDVKNISHCIRLLTMGEELIKGLGFRVDRSDIDRDFILSVKNGEWNYDDIMKIAEEKKLYIEQNIKSCSLPNKVDPEFFNDILVNIRKKFI
jgi:hypothetical protein